MRDEALADRVFLVSGRDDTEMWKETNASSLAPMFKTFRKELASQLAHRFKLDTTPSKHVLLALKMNPSVNTESHSALLAGKCAMEEMMIAEYKRALRRQCILVKQAHLPSPLCVETPPAVDAPMTGVAPEAEHETPKPVAKRRKGLLGAVAAQQANADTPDDASSAIDSEVQAEIERFLLISQNIIAKGKDHPYYQATSRFNLQAFWADHKSIVPLHYAVYLANVGCIKSASANVESVFSGAGKFSKTALSAGHQLLSRMVKLHYNWKYTFLRPSMEDIVKRYNEKFRPNVANTMAKKAAASKGGSSSG